MRRRRRASGGLQRQPQFLLLVVLLLSSSLVAVVATFVPPAPPRLRPSDLLRPPPAAALATSPPRPAPRPVAAAAVAAAAAGAAAAAAHNADDSEEAAPPPLHLQPRHLAIIPDGNGRWAQQRGLPRVAGHQEGAKRAFEVLQACQELGGIKVVTLYCLSTENWRRPAAEINVILRCVEAGLRANLAYAHANRIRLTVVGQRERLPASLQRLIARAEAETGGYDGLTACLALSYGGRDDIVQAARRLAAEAASGRLRVEEIDEAAFARRLQTGALGGLGAGLGEPDLVVRTSGERRLSNFMLFESAYAELYVAEALWPAFGRRELWAAVWDYAGRRRRFGGVGGDGGEEGGSALAPSVVTSSQGAS